MNKEAQVGLFIIVAIFILFYLSINIGAVRLFSNSYFLYKTYFDDVVGLEVKSPVKISGITVGWVESINLTDKGKAEVTIRVNRAHKLFKNSYATITQDSLLGNKILEVDSGDSSSGILPPGSVLHMPGRSSASLSDILEGVKDITNSIQEVAHSFNKVFSSSPGEEKMQKTLDNAAISTEYISKFAIKLNDTISNNQEKISNITNNLDFGIESISKAIPEIQENLNETIKEARSAVECSKVTIQNATLTTKSAKNISSKIERGEGTIGKLINDEDIYYGVKETVDGLKDFVGKAYSLEITLDAHNEQYRRINNNRGELNIILKLRDDYFYIIQLAADNFGKFYHETSYHDYFYEDGVTPIERFSNSIGVNDPSQTITMSGFQKALASPIRKKTTVDPTAIRKGFQVAKRFYQATLRAGMFEDTFGIAVDYKIPLKSEKINWVTTIEAFDFTGFNRINDDRPHVKWANRVYMFKNLYTYFGLDDIFSRKTAAPFWGAGLSFDDDDIKFLLYSFIGKS